MTKLALFLSSLMLVAANAQAEVSVTSAEIASLPVLQNVKVVRNVPSPMLMVQPTGNVTFTYSSCAQQSFEADVVEDATGIVIVKVLLNLGRECHGPVVARDYSVQISSDMDIFSRVTVLNPTYPTSK